MTFLSVIALEKLAERPLTCTELGEALWGWGGKRHVNRQSYARPAGKVIQRLVRDGLVERVFPEGWQDRSAQYATVTKEPTR